MTPATIARLALIVSALVLPAQTPKPTQLDLRILHKADELLSAESKWNRNDTRECPAGQQKVSLFCALHDASIEVAGQYEHRRLALELVRKTVAPLLAGKKVEHRLRDFNNLPETTFAQVKSVLKTTIEHVEADLAAMKRAARTVAPGWSERGLDTTGTDQTGGAPRAWIVSDVFHGGKQAARLSTDRETEQVSLIQSALPGAFAGKRIRFSGYMKTEMAKGRAMFSIQAEDANGNRIAFDRMIGRQVRGKTDWTRYDIVMDIPRETRFFFYHPTIVGTGTAWFDDLSIKAVDPSTPLTTPDNGAGTIGTLSKRTGKQKQNLDRRASSALAAPLNLDFEREH